MSPSRLTVEAWPVTDKGQADENQDSVLIYEPSNANQVRFSGNLYIVADGAGSGTQGKLASEYTARKIMHFYYTHDEPDLGLRLREAIEEANTDLFNYSKQQPELVKMGSTLVVAAMRGEELHVAWVGDGRAYVIRDGAIEQLTRDHTLVQQLLDEQAISEDEAKEHPRRDVVLRALGSEEEIRVDVLDTRLKPDDALVLCSGALTRYLHPDEIASIVGSQSPRSAAETLVQKMLDRGGKENVSVVTALLRDGAPPIMTITEHTWDGQPASFDQQPTLMIRRADIESVAPIPDQTVPTDIDARQFLDSQNAPVGTSLPPDIPEPPITPGDTMVSQRPYIPDQSSAAPMQPPVQPAPPYQQGMQPAPPYNQPAQQYPPAQPQYQQPAYGQRGVPRGYTIDPVTGLPPIPQGGEANYGGYPPPGYPQYGPRVYQQPGVPNVSARRGGIPLGTVVFAGTLAVILTALMVIILVNPLNWEIPFLGGSGEASGNETPATEQTQIAGGSGATPTPPLQSTSAGPTQETGGATGGAAPVITATAQTQVPEGMVLIEAGSFRRGVDEAEEQEAEHQCILEGGGTCNPEYFNDARPVADVTISPFFMDITEVTNLMYASCVAAEVCTPPSDQQFYADPAYGQHPIVFVTYAQANQYCTWAGKRLPTEAEWEKAARWDPTSQKSLVFPWGDEYTPGKANTKAAGQKGTSAVQAFVQDISPLGVLDMTGNVSEWVSDWYYPGYKDLPTTDPTGPTNQALNQAQRLVRGGSFLELMAFSRGGHRLSANPEKDANWIGFRCAKSVNGAGPASVSATPPGTPTTPGAALPATITSSPQP